MGLKPDHWIRKMAHEHRMIEPFEDKQVRQGVISYGVSSYGYDVRVADEFKIFTNVFSATVDPKNFDTKSMVDYIGDVCTVPPNSFALARTVEYFRIPRNVLTICLGKSTYARCGIIGTYGVGRELTGLGEELDAVHARHVHVGHDHGVGTVDTHLGQGGLAAEGGVDSELLRRLRW